MFCSQHLRCSGSQPKHVSNPRRKNFHPLFHLFAGTADTVFQHDKFGTSGSVVDQQIVQWHLRPVVPKTCEQYFAAAKWAHKAYPGKVFVKTKVPTASGGAGPVAWQCALGVREWRNVSQGGGHCADYASKCPFYFKPEGSSSSGVVCARCMFNYGHAALPAADGAGAADTATSNGFSPSMHSYSEEIAPFPLLGEIPLPVLQCRAAVLAHFMEQGVLSEDLLPAFLSSSRISILSDLSSLVPYPSKQAIIKRAISSSMNTSDSNRPRLTVNRLGLVASSNGVIGPHGSKSVFAQVMTQMTTKAKQVTNLWLRSKRLFKLDRLAGEGIEDAGGGYLEILSHMMKELAVDADGKSALELFIRYSKHIITSLLLFKMEPHILS